MYPTFPVLMESLGSWFNFKTPISSASYVFPVLTNFTLSPFLISPLKTRKYTSIPLKELKTESNIMACKGASGSPVGAGILSTMDSKISGIPIPSLALAWITSEGSHPISSTIWSVTSSGIALGRSILFKTGMISRSCSNAR